MSEIRVDTISEKTTANGVSIDSVTLKDGGATLSDNLLFNASGKGVYLGVTSATASNLLDDYEEGTWTPTIQSSGGGSSGSFNNLASFYRKIGNTVYLYTFIQDIDTTGMTAGELRIGGVPFVSQNDDFSVGSIRVTNLNFSGDFVTPQMFDLRDFMQIYENTSSGNIASTQIADISSGITDFIISITYTTS